jgi:hypothetical protein
MLAHVRRTARRNTENRPRQPPTVIRATIHQKNKPRATTARSSHAFAFAYTVHFQAHISLRPEIEHCLSATARSSHAPATRRRPRRWSKCSTSERTWELSLFRQLDEILKIVELMRGKTLLLTFSGSHFCQPTLAWSTKMFLKRRIIVWIPVELLRDTWLESTLLKLEVS